MKSEIILNKIIKSFNKSSSYEDIMVLFFILTALFIDFLPYFDSFEIIAPQFFYLSILNLIIGVFIYFNSAFHHKSIVETFKRSYIFKIYLGFILLSSISIFTARNISLGVLSIAEILVVFGLLLNFTILLYHRTYLIYKIAFLIGICVLFQAGLVLYDFALTAYYSSFSQALVSDLFKGNTGNVNIFSASILFKVAFVFIGIAKFSDWKRWLLCVAFLLIVLAVLFINARASLISLILITILFCVFYIKNNGVKRQNFVTLLYVVIPLSVALITANLILNTANLEGRYSSTTDRLRQINSEDGSVSRRLLFYRITLEMVKNNPVLGIGLGNFRIESIPYDLSNNLNIPLHAHNDFLELAAETGILNGLLYFLIFVGLLVVNLKRLIKVNDREVRNVALLTLMLLIVYGVDAVFNFPFYRPTMQLCFCFIMVFTFINVVKVEHTSVIKRSFLIGLILVVLMPLYVIYYAFLTSRLENTIQRDNINYSTSGVINGEDVLKLKPKIPNVFQSSESFVEYAGIYFFREKKYDKAMNLLDSANTINSYLGRPDFYKYLIASEMQENDSSYLYLKRAFYKRPNSENFYHNGINVAAARKDSTEIIKMYEAFPEIATKPKIWISAYEALGSIGYSKKGLNEFKQIGAKNFAKDSLFVKYLIEN